MKNRSFPDYFVALFKQQANLVSNDEAVRTAQSIANGLYFNLDEIRRELIFGAMPAYLSPKKQVFFARRNNKTTYDVRRFVRHVMIQAGLTDEKELQKDLRAFFGTVKILSDTTSNQTIADSLPASLQKLFVQA